MAGPEDVRGRVAPGFEPVRAAFEKTLRPRRERGAAVALVRDGETLVDLWGGVRDETGAPWTADTRVLAYSVTKGLSAAALLWLHARGHLDLDAPVAALWPAFAASGKARVIIRTLLAHQAGLAAVKGGFPPHVVADREALEARLAAQAPAWPPGARHAYHAISLGFYEDALARRADPLGRGLAELLAEEIGPAIGAPITLGTGGGPSGPVARIAPFAPWRAFLHPRSVSPRFLLALACPPTLPARAVRALRIRGPAALDGEVWRGLAVPASNAYVSARAVASLYADLAGDGARLALGAAARAALRAPAVPPARGDWDAVFKRRTAYALGFMRPSAHFAFGTTPEAFGAPGVGGSFGFGDPATRTGYAYLTSRLGFNVFDDPRETALRRACFDALFT